MPNVCVSAGPIKCEAWVAEPYDAAGRLDVPGDNFLMSRVMGTSPDGQLVYVAGTSDIGPTTDSSYNYDMVTLAYDAGSGKRAWVAGYPGTAGEPHVIAYSLAVSSAGGSVVVTGESFSSDGSRYGAITAAYDPKTGEQQWATHLADLIPSSVAVSTDGSRVYVSGTAVVDGEDNPSAAGLLAYDAATGRLLWEADAIGNGHAGATGGVAVSPDGSRVYQVGYEAEPIPSGPYSGLYFTARYVVLAYDAGAGETAGTGVLAWRSAHDTVGNPPSGIIPSPDGSRLFVTGGSAQMDQCSPTGFPFCQFDYLTYAVDSATGAELWAALYGETSPDGVLGPYNFDVPWFWGPLAVSPDGTHVYVAGSTNSTSPQDVALRETTRHETVAYDTASGKQLWVNRFVSPSQRWAPITYIPYFEAIAVTPDGKELVVTGQGSGEMDTTGIDAATGGQLWIARYSVGLSGADAVAASPDGSRVFVAGFDDANCIPFFCATSTDIQVLAYDTG